MPTYQLTVYVCDPVVGGPIRMTSDTADPGGVGTLQALRAVGGTFRLTGAVGTMVVVAESGGIRVLTADPAISPDWHGQPLQIEARLAIRMDAGLGPAHEVEMQLVGIGPDVKPLARGLASATPLDPDATYTVVGVTEPQPSPVNLRAVGCDKLACFTHGTLIDTPDGPRLIETLQPGDLVTTLDNGSQPLRWVGQKAVSARDMAANPGLRPVRFDSGTIGNARTLLVSAQHRLLLADWRAEVYFGEDQVLIAARALINGASIRQVMPEGGVTYCHLLFDRHEVILAEGALSESFHPGDMGLDGLDEAQRHEIEALFPLLALEDRRAAFPIVRLNEANDLPFVL